MWLLLVQLAALALTGRVVNPSGVPVPGATVHVYVCPRGPDHCDAVNTATTDATGAFAVDGTGTVRIVAMRHFEAIVEAPLPETFVLEPIPPGPLSADTLRRFRGQQVYGDCVGHYLRPPDVRVDLPSGDGRWAALDAALARIESHACRAPVSMYPRNPYVVAGSRVTAQLGGGRLSVVEVDPEGLFPEQITCIRALLDGFPVDASLSGPVTVRVCH